MSGQESILVALLPGQHRPPEIASAVTPPTARPCSHAVRSMSLAQFPNRSSVNITSMWKPHHIAGRPAAALGASGHVCLSNTRTGRCSCRAAGAAAASRATERATRELRTTLCTRGASWLAASRMTPAVLTGYGLFSLGCWHGAACHFASCHVKRPSESGEINMAYK